MFVDAGARYYQKDAADAPFTYWGGGGGNGIIQVPTGGGKGRILGVVARRLVEDFGARPLILTHVQELVEQDAEEIKGIWPDQRVGINSSGLGFRDVKDDVLVASVQSVYRNMDALGDRHVLLIDEAQLVSRKTQSMYGRAILEMRKRVPHMRVLGLSATPYRMDTGLLTEKWKDQEPLFDDVIYEISIKTLIEQGYLCPVIPRAPKTRLDVAGVKKRGGDFIAGELEKAVDREDITRAAIDEVMEVMASGRRMALIGAAGADHARHIAEEIKSRHGKECAVLLGETDKRDRADMIRRAKNGELPCLVGVNAIMVGLNIPHIDVLACLRPTESRGLWVQYVGRGTRNAEGKTDCLVLDFAGNTARHGPVDMIDGGKSPGEGGAPVKECPECATIMFAGLMKCPSCGHVFPEPILKITAQSSTAALISGQKPPEWFYVSAVLFRRHDKLLESGGYSSSLRVDFLIGATTISHWVPLESEKGRRLAERWWRRWSTMDPGHTALGTSFVPTTVSEALERVQRGELREPGRILCQQEGKYWRVLEEDWRIPPGELMRA